MTAQAGAKSDVYWLHMSSKDAINHLIEMRDLFISYNSSPVRQAWVRNFTAYYSAAIAPTSYDSSLIFEGDKGELVRMYVPKARSIIRRQVNLVAKQKIAAQALAQSDGADVIQDLKLGNSVIDQIIERENVDIKYRELLEGGLVCGAWFWEVTWRTDKGEPYVRGPNDEIIYTGGVDISLQSVFDTFFDMSIPWSQLSYAESRTPMNRWDLIAQHPNLKDEILSLPSVTEERQSSSWFNRNRGTDDDLVYIYKMYARISPALPVGRMIIYGSDTCVFYDDENIYKDIPIIPFMPEKVIGAGFGYPSLTNLLAAQEMMDNSFSAIATNESQFAVQNVTIPRGSDVNVNELSGMKFISYTPQNVPGGGKPEPLNLNMSSPNTFKFADILNEKMEDLSPGINQTLSGNPPPGVTSGTAIATLSANGIESINDVMTFGTRSVTEMLMMAVNCYKLFSNLDQNVVVKGKNQKMMNRKFSSKDLKSISGIKIQLQNPLMQTIAGRLEIAEKLMTMPREMWPQYVAILEGEPLKDIYKGDITQIDLIHSENELLVQGKHVFALSTDDHGAHAQSHADLLNDPAVRLNGEYIQTILNHLLEHDQLAKTTDPFLTAMIRTGKIPQLPPEQMGMAQQGAQGPQGAPNPTQQPGANQREGRVNHNSGARPANNLGVPTKETALPSKTARDALDRQQMPDMG